MSNVITDGAVGNETDTANYTDIIPVASNDPISLKAMN